MVQITYSDGGWLLTLFKTIGLGMTIMNNEEERSITVTFKIAKAHTFFTLAWL